MGLLTSISNNVLQSILTYVKSRYVPVFNINNKATGVGTVTLNETSGEITYTQKITGGFPLGYQLNNNKITANSVIFWSIKYEQLADESLVQGSYICSTGFATFYVGVQGDTESYENTVINFRIE